MERQVAAAGGLVLRLGHLYGPGSSYDRNGGFARQVVAGKAPIVGTGGAVFSFIHARDVASAILAAVDRSVLGVLNIVDDDPAPVREWLPLLAELLGAPAPKTVPAWLARLAAGDWGVAFLTRLVGASNARARKELGWEPAYPSWREGFTADLG
jgi:nucleoside-diphosphate-sugar epimerase